jgi:hypothetical protein
LISLHGFEMTKRTILAELTEHAALAPKDKNRRGALRTSLKNKQRHKVLLSLRANWREERVHKPDNNAYTD